MPSSQKRVDVVAGLIQDSEGRLLACRRKEAGELPGEWEFPGGKVEPGETVFAALIRELREELDLLILPARVLTPVDHDHDEKRIRLIPVTCTIIAGEPQLRVHSECRWCHASELDHLNLSSPDRQILAEWRTENF